MSSEQYISQRLALMTLANAPLAFPDEVNDIDEAAAILFLEQLEKKGLCKKSRPEDILTYEITEAGRAALANK